MACSISVIISPLCTLGPSSLLPRFSSKLPSSLSPRSPDSLFLSSDSMPFDYPAFLPWPLLYRSPKKRPQTTQMFRVKDPKVSLDFYSRVLGMSILQQRQLIQFKELFGPLARSSCLN